MSVYFLNKPNKLIISLDNKLFCWFVMYVQTFPDTKYTAAILVLIPSPFLLLL